jgi:hypothetical protein
MSFMKSFAEGFFETSANTLTERKKATEEADRQKAMVMQKLDADKQLLDHKAKQDEAKAKAEREETRAMLEASGMVQFTQNTMTEGAPRTAPKPLSMEQLYKVRESGIMSGNKTIADMAENRIKSMEAGTKQERTPTLTSEGVDFGQEAFKARQKKTYTESFTSDWGIKDNKKIIPASSADRAYVETEKKLDSANTTLLNDLLINSATTPTGKVSNLTADQISKYSSAIIASSYAYQNAQTESEASAAHLDYVNAISNISDKLIGGDYGPTAEAILEEAGLPVPQPIGAISDPAAQNAILTGDPEMSIDELRQDIKQQYKSGAITREQAIERLNKLGQ